MRVGDLEGQVCGERGVGRGPGGAGAEQKGLAGEGDLDGQVRWQKGAGEGDLDGQVHGHKGGRSGDLDGRMCGSQKGGVVDLEDSYKRSAFTPSGCMRGSMWVGRARQLHILPQGALQGLTSHMDCCPIPAGVQAAATCVHIKHHQVPPVKLVAAPTAAGFQAAAADQQNAFLNATFGDRKSIAAPSPAGVQAAAAD